MYISVYQGLTPFCVMEFTRLPFFLIKKNVFHEMKWGRKNLGLFLAFVARSDIVFYSFCSLYDAFPFEITVFLLL